MKKKIINIIMIAVICISVNMCYHQVWAMPTVQEGGSSSVGINPYSYKPDSLEEVNDAEKIKEIGNNIIGTLQIIGSILSVVVLVVMGIKYMVGSVEERAEYKKSMLPYVIGAVMVFTITNLLGIIASIAKELFL